MKIKLTADCPECDEQMVINMEVFNDDQSIDISCFEQQTFHCNNCNTDFHTGDIDLLSDEDLGV